jgi:Leucine-rich repeat (LRR) protein
MRRSDRSAAPHIPTDLVQNTVEYSDRVACLLSFRGVSTEWQGAVSDAVGFLNGRCWTQLANGNNDRALWASLRLDDAALVTRCALLCLRPRLETWEWTPRTNTDRWHRLPLRLLGESNTVLTALSVVPDGGWSGIYLTIFEELRRCSALRELSLCSSHITNDTFRGHEALLARLHKLDLSGCSQLTAISNLAPCVSLRELNVSSSSVEDLRGLEQLVALETLDVTGTWVSEWTILRQCPRLTALSASGNLQAVVDVAAHCLIRYDGCVCDDDTDAAVVMRTCFPRCPKLRELSLAIGPDNSSMQVLAAMPTLQVLGFCWHIYDLRPLSESCSLRELCVSNSMLTNAEIAGLERIATLEKLDLTSCARITSVAHLRHSAALRELILSGTCVNDAGIEGLERIATLTSLALSGCTSITSVSTLRTSPSLRELDISSTAVTSAGIEGLEEIGTLERLDVSWCTALRDTATLRGCRGLVVIGGNPDHE